MRISGVPKQILKNESKKKKCQNDFKKRKAKDETCNCTPLRRTLRKRVPHL